MDHCGSLWDRCGSLWIVVDRCGSLWVVPGCSNYASFVVFWGFLRTGFYL